MKMMKGRRFGRLVIGVASVGLSWVLPVHAEVRLPQIFSDHMILQQKSSNTIWGFAEPGEAVRVKASWGSSAETKAGEDGRWKVFLKTPSHGTGHGLTIQGENTITLNRQTMTRPMRGRL